MQHQKRGWLVNKDLGRLRRSGQVQNFFCPCIFLDSLRKTTKILRQDGRNLHRGREETVIVFNRTPGRDLNPGHSKYEAAFYPLGCRFFECCFWFWGPRFVTKFGSESWFPECQGRLDVTFSRYRTAGSATRSVGRVLLPSQDFRCEAPSQQHWIRIDFECSSHFTRTELRPHTLSGVVTFLVVLFPSNQK